MSRGEEDIEIRREVKKSLVGRTSNQVDSPLPEAKLDGEIETVNLLKKLREAIAHLSQDNKKCFGPDERLKPWSFWHPSLSVTFFYRFARAFDLAGWTPLARLITAFGRFFNKCDIHYRANIEPGVLFPHGLGVVIGEGVSIQKGCSIFQHCSLGSAEGKTGFPILEEGVNLYPGTVVAGPLTIGEYARVGPNVYLTGSVPNHTRILPPQAFQKPNTP